MHSIRALGLSCALLGALSAVGCWNEEPATGKPHHAAGGRDDDGSPLIKDRLEDDAAVARAMREYYTKYQYRIPMRDGVKLFTVAYVPKDTSRTYPIMLHRTPYSVAPYGIDSYPRGGSMFGAGFVREGFIIVMQDVRGQLMSEGKYVDIRPHAGDGGNHSGIDESTDAYDTVDFLVKNVPENNGRVGVSGVSYPGFYAAQAAVNSHPAVKAVSPQAPVTEWFIGDDFHHHGAFFLAEAFDFYASFGKPRKHEKPTTKQEWGFDYGGADAYDYFLTLGSVMKADERFEKKVPFWGEILSHPNRDEWWKARDPRPHYVAKGAAIMTVGGFFDAEDCYGALETYRAFEKQSPRGAQNALVMGPWRHGGWHHGAGDRHGDIMFGQPTARYFRDEIELPFFMQHLKGRGTGLGGFEAIVFETGTNVWQHYGAWPPPGAKTATLRLQGHGLLGSGAGPSGDEGFDSYVSDPLHPVPHSAKLSSTIDEDYMTEDQRFAQRRTDVLTYASGDLTSDVTLSGPLEATLFVSTTGTDADFVVKLIDGYPQDDNPTGEARDASGVAMGGYEMLVRGEIMRARFRESDERPVPFEPGKPTKVHFTMPDVAHTFRTGHRLMIQVQSTWFPLVDRNPQVFVPNIELADLKDGDFQVATQRVYRMPDLPSGITVTVSRGTLPP